MPPFHPGHCLRILPALGDLSGEVEAQQSLCPLLSRILVPPCGGWAALAPPPHLIWPLTLSPSPVPSCYWHVHRLQATQTGLLPWPALMCGDSSLP